MELIVLGSLGLLGFQFSKQKQNDSSNIEEIVVLEEPNIYPIEDDNLNMEDLSDLSEEDSNKLDEYMKMSVKELKSKCIEMNLQHSGNKSTLAKRIVDNLN